MLRAHRELASLIDTPTKAAHAIVIAVALVCSSSCAQTEGSEPAAESEPAERALTVPAVGLGGVYAPCRVYRATPEGHWRAGRATRISVDGKATYKARGSQTPLTQSASLAETGKDFFELAARCPLPADCVRSASQPPSGLALHCRVQVRDQGPRDYDLHIPNQHENLSPVPLVMEMHAGGGAAAPPASELISGWREVSDTSAQPFIVAWPVGSHEGDGPPGEEWQTCNYQTTTSPQGCPAPGYPDDRRFLIEALKKIVEDLGIDTSRIYATGLSSGAAMVHTLACGYADYFAAVAPMATGMKVEQQPRARDNFDLTVGCAPARAVPIFYVHSPHDPIASFAEGAASVAFWRAKHGCSSVATESYASDVDFADPTDQGYPASYDRTVCRTTLCGPQSSPAASAVAFCEVDGSSDLLNAGGHAVWLGDDFFFPIVQPRAPRLAQWAWDWMRAFALPSAPPWPPPTR